MTKLRVAVIGAGMAGRGHIAAYSLLRDRVEVTSVVDIRQDVAEMAAKEAGGVKVLTDYKAALRSPETDAVDICAPNLFHEEMAVAAAEAGKHILCEKPMARTLAEADRMIDAARRHSVKFMMAHNWLYFPCNRYLKSLVDEGFLGEVFHARTRIELWRPPLEWRRSMSALGGGCLINDGVHQLYTLRWLLGDYKGVFALLGNYAQREMEGEDTASLLVQFKNGAIGEVTTTWACVLPATPRPTPTIELRGKESTVLASPWEHRAKLYRRGQKTDAFEEWTAPSVQRDALTTASAPNAWVATVRDEIRDFVECIVEDREPPITAQDGRAVLQVILGAYESAQRQSWVELH